MNVISEELGDAEDTRAEADTYRGKVKALNLAIALADLIQFVDDVAQIGADLLDFFVALADAVGDNGFALTRVFKLHALGEEFAFVFLKIDFQDVVVSFLPQAIAIDLIRVGNAKTFQIIVHNGTFDSIITIE